MTTALHSAAEPQVMSRDQPLVDVRKLRVWFPINRGFFRRTIGLVKAVDGVDLTIHPGETLGLVGESGSGKTTVGRALIQLIRATDGQIVLEGVDISKASGEQLRRIRRRVGMVFQDPYGSLNPRMSAGEIVGDPLKVHRLCRSITEYRNRVNELFTIVGLNSAMANRFPHEFSGGQRQRLGVARALSVNPALIILDEPVSSLDVSIQAQVINLLQEVQDRYGVAYLFIAHDLSVVRHVSHRVAVMYLGRVVETASRKAVYDHPLHPYTQALLSAVPAPNPRLERNRKRIILKGDIPSPANPPSGCVFHTRCPVAVADCARVVPELKEIEQGHRVACIRVPGYSN